jgi:hypothetical protein
MGGCDDIERVARRSVPASADLALAESCAARDL